MQNLKKNGRKGETPADLFALQLWPHFFVCLFLTNMKLKDFQNIFLCWWIEISHATNFWKAVFEDIKYLITEIPGFTCILQVYHWQILVN